MPLLDSLLGALGSLVGEAAAYADAGRARIAVGEALHLEPDSAKRDLVYRPWMEGTQGYTDPKEIVFVARVLATVNMLAPPAILNLDAILAAEFGGMDYNVPPAMRTPAILEWSPADLTLWLTHVLLSDKNKDRLEGGPAADEALRRIAASVVRRYINQRTSPLAEAPDDAPDADDPARAIPYLLPPAQFVDNAVRTAGVPLPYTQRRTAATLVLLVRDPNPDDYLVAAKAPEPLDDSSSWWWATGLAALSGGYYVGRAYKNKRERA